MQQNKNNYSIEYENKIKLECSNNIFLSFILSKFNIIYSNKTKNNILNILSILNSENIDILNLKKIVFNGLPDDISCIRSLIWKILLNTLSLNINEWNDNLNNNRKKYNEYKNKLNEQMKIFNKCKIKYDHPLNINNNSKWKKYFDDLELLNQIKKDIYRTKTHLNFFSKPCKLNENESNSDVMLRILFIYSKKHPEVKYVQGMNEILAPIFYCYSIDNNPYFLDYLEEDSFNSFENLMEKIKINFIKKYDNQEDGVTNKLKIFHKLLKLIDYDIYKDLEKYNIKMEYFAFKWVTLFFTQDFDMPGILRLWDSLLSDDDLYDFLNMLMLGILRINKKNILNNDFPGIMTNLQNIEEIEVEDLIENAIQIRKELNENFA